MSEASGETDDCLVACEGLYADIRHIDATEDFNELTAIITQYNSHKDMYAKNMAFDPYSKSFSK